MIFAINLILWGVLGILLAHRNITWRDPVYWLILLNVLAIQAIVNVR